MLRAGLGSLGVTGAVALAGSVPAAAQYNPVMVDVIGQTVAGMYSGQPDRQCLSEAKRPKPADVAKARAYADAVFDQYVQQSTARADVTRSFSHSKKFRDWTVDGVKQDVATGRDPWLGAGVRVEPLGFVQGNAKIRYRGMWRAVRADGAVLGTYDGVLQREDGGARFLSLDLYTPSAAKQPKPLTMFCSFPGDVEAFREAEAKRAAEKAARKARSGD